MKIPQSVPLPADWLTEGRCNNGQYVPVLTPSLDPPDDPERSRVLLVFAEARSIDLAFLPSPFLVEDYVCGMELLGFQFTLADDAGEPVLFLIEPNELPESWDRHAIRLRRVFGRDRSEEIIAFLQDRESAR